MTPNPHYEAIIDRVHAAATKLRDGGVGAEAALDAATELWVATNPPVVSDVDDDGEDWKNN